MRAPLATDQRYCLNCGSARTEPRLDFKKHLAPALAGTPDARRCGRRAAGPAGRRPVGMQQVNPITAIFAIALLAVMLLLGVLIGKDDDPATVAAAPATTTTAPVATTPTDTTAAAPAKDKGKDKGGDGARRGQRRARAAPARPRASRLPTRRGLDRQEDAEGARTWSRPRARRKSWIPMARSAAAAMRSASGADAGERADGDARDDPDSQR